MREHLSDAVLNSLADGELSAEADGWRACASGRMPGVYDEWVVADDAEVSYGARGQRYELGDDLRERLLQRVSKQSATPSTSAGGAWMGWVAAAAMLLVFASVGVVQRHSAGKAEETALLAEVSDQHVAMMAANAPPEVISTDRHTVKPWFQGKIPFSFNLPEGLPSDTTLDGANLAYLRHRPVAQLLYSIGKHRVSVFVQEKDGAGATELTVEQAGFHVVAFSTKELEVVAVSDVDPARLSGLAEMIRNAQAR